MRFRVGPFSWKAIQDSRARGIQWRCWRRLRVLVGVVGVAGEILWSDTKRGFEGTVVVDHQPYNHGGFASDTLFRKNEFLPPTWQLVADDIDLPASTVVD